MSIELRNVVLTYREPSGAPIPILNVPSYAVAQGEQAVLLGASGGGKTSLLNIIAGITVPTSGEVIVAGTAIHRLVEPARDRFRSLKIGYVFQTFNLLPAFTALENVLLGMSFSGGRADRNAAVRLLQQVGLGHRLNNRPIQLSVGEQQRVSVARALAKTPRVLLADEPTANVDTANQQLVIDLIRAACQEQGVTLLLVTHATDVASQFSRVDQLASFNQVAAPLRSPTLAGAPA
jgi:putative ABC transport system ATP-binding protein